MRIIRFEEKYFDEVMKLHELNVKEHQIYDKKKYCEINEEFLSQGLDIFIAIDKEVLGYIAVILKKSIICEMYSKYKNIGIGTKLMNYVLTRMEGTIKLKVEPKNFKARGFYKKIGFTETGEFDMTK